MCTSRLGYRRSINSDKTRNKQLLLERIELPTKRPPLDSTPNNRNQNYCWAKRWEIDCCHPLTRRKYQCKPQGFQCIFEGVSKKRVSTKNENDKQPRLFLEHRSDLTTHRNRVPPPLLYRVVIPHTCHTVEETSPPYRTSDRSCFRSSGSCGFCFGCCARAISYRSHPADMFTKALPNNQHRASMICTVQTVQTI